MEGEAVRVTTVPGAYEAASGDRPIDPPADGDTVVVSAGEGVTPYRKMPPPLVPAYRAAGTLVSKASGRIYRVKTPVTTAVQWSPLSVERKRPPSSMPA